MNNIALIGLGTISDKYRNGLIESSTFNLCAICDIDESKLYNNKFNLNISKYINYKDLLENRTQLDLNSVLIATTPKTHFEIAKYFLENGINVFVEKPATTNLEELIELYNIAKANNTQFNVMFHWVFGSEIVYLQQRIDDYIKNYGKITKIETLVNDPYCDETKEHIKQEKIALSGTWLDCGINCLSMINSVVKVDNISIKNQDYKIDDNCGLLYFSDFDFVLNNSIDIKIRVDWREQKNFKRTFIYFENGAVMFINHQDQIIFMASNEQEKEQLNKFVKELENFHDAVKIFRPDFIFDYLKVECDFDKFTKEDRLHTHYYNLFTQRNIDKINNEMVERNKTEEEIVSNFKVIFDLDTMLKVHKVLFNYNIVK